MLVEIHLRSSAFETHLNAESPKRGHLVNLQAAGRSSTTPRISYSTRLIFHYVFVFAVPLVAAAAAVVIAVVVVAHASLSLLRCRR